MGDWEDVAAEYQKSGKPPTVSSPTEKEPDYSIWGTQDAPQSKIQKMVGNIPGSAKRALLNPYGEGMPASVQENYPRGTYPPGFDDYAPKISKFMEHPIDNTIKAVQDKFTDDPVGSGLAVAAGGRAAFPKAAGAVDAGISGAGRGAVNAAKNLEHGVFARSGLGYGIGRAFGHGETGAIIGASLPVAKGAFTGARDAVSEYRNGVKTSPFDLPQEKPMPSSGGQSFNPKPTGIDGVTADKPAPNEYRPLQAPEPTYTDQPLTGYPKEQPQRNTGSPELPQWMKERVTPMETPPTKQTRPVVRVDKSGPPDIEVGPTPRPALRSGRQPGAMPAETQPVKPETPAATHVPEPETAPQNAPNEVTSVEENASKSAADLGITDDDIAQIVKDPEMKQLLQDNHPEVLADWEARNPVLNGQYRQVTRKLVTDENGQPTAHIPVSSNYRNPKGLGSIKKVKLNEIPDDTSGELFKPGTAPEDASPELQDRLQAGRAEDVKLSNKGRKLKIKQ